MNASTDRIEKGILLKAPRSRVWRALADAGEFGEWFGVAFGGKSFAPGSHVRGNMTHSGYEHVVCEMWVERVEPEHLFSFRWHPYAIDPKVDYSKEPTTLVVFELKDTDDGTLLSVVESGFDKVPASRRAEAFRMNSGGWEWQIARIQKYVDAA
jgi:uncharacterized protein YndB with AHSA1/START domain